MEKGYFTPQRMGKAGRGSSEQRKRGESINCTCGSYTGLQKRAHGTSWSARLVTVREEETQNCRWHLDHEGLECQVKESAFRLNNGKPQKGLVRMWNAKRRAPYDPTDS